MGDETLHGLIQHSFGMRVPPELHPLYTREGARSGERLLDAIFSVPPTENFGGFELGKAGMGSTDPTDRTTTRSRLVRERQTNIEPLRLPFSDPGNRPRVLAWGDDGCGAGSHAAESWRGFAFGDRRSDGRHSRRNDFLLEPTGAGAYPVGDGWKTARFLCQLLAHRRSRLFGLTLARDTFNLLLPHATLIEKGRPRWLVQTVVSLSLLRWHGGFRPIFSVSLFMLPVEAGSEQGSHSVPGGADPPLDKRGMWPREISQSVRDGWSLATVHELEHEPEYTVRGPLGEYLASMRAALGRSLQLTPRPYGWIEGGTGDATTAPLTLRSFAEAILFCVSLKLARGRRGQLGEEARKTLGDLVLTSISASRVSSVVVVDNSCKGHPEAPCPRSDLAALLGDLSEEISGPFRTAHPPGFRLDRAYFDRHTYRIGVIPAHRCVVTVADRCTQDLDRESVLLEAGWTALMVIGTATATGLIRGVYRNLAASDPGEPARIADIEREAMVDLYETYDLEITMEAYRERYRLLRQHLGITSEYEALSDKLEALHRETSTRFGARSERRLTALTWGTVILSAFIVLGTFMLIFKGG